MTPCVGAAAERAGARRGHRFPSPRLPTTDSNGGSQHEQRLVLEPSSSKNTCMAVRTGRQEGGAFLHWARGGLWEASACQWGWTLNAGWNRNLTLDHQSTCPWQKQNLEKSEYKTSPLSVSRDVPRFPCAITTDSVNGPRHSRVPRTWTEVRYQNKETKP